MFKALAALLLHPTITAMRPGGRILWMIALCAVIAPCGHAQAQATGAAGPRSPDEARQLRDRASAMKTQAEQQFASEKSECYRKILPNLCLDTASRKRQEKLTQANELARQGRTEEREIRQQEREAKEAQRNADAPRVAAEEKARIEQFQEDHTRRDAQRASKPTQDADESARRLAKVEAEAAARQQKQAERARKDAEHERNKAALIKARQNREREIAEHAAYLDKRAKEKADDQKRREADKAAQRAEAEEAKEHAGKNGFLCQLWPARFCAPAKLGK